MGCCFSKPDVSIPVKSQISANSVEIESINGKLPSTNLLFLKKKHICLFFSF